MGEQHERALAGVRLKARPIARGRRVLGWAATARVRGIRVALCVGHLHSARHLARWCPRARKKAKRLKL